MLLHVLRYFVDFVETCIEWTSPENVIFREIGHHVTISSIISPNLPCKFDDIW